MRGVQPDSNAAATGSGPLCIVMVQLPSWQWDCAPWQGRCCIPGVAAKQCISVSLSFVVLIVGLPLTMPSPVAVSFAPVFTAAPGMPAGQLSYDHS